MNREEKRRQRKKAEKAAKKAKPEQSASPSPERQSPTIQQSLDLAVQHHTAGRLPEAERIYQKILQADPSQPVALHLLGVIAHQVGKNDIAVDLITRALAIKPDYAEAHNNLGVALRGLGKLNEAVASYHKVLAIKPDYAEAHYNLGIALRGLGKSDEAVASYHKALAIKPDYVEAHYNLGVALRGLGKSDEAVASYHKALAIKPDYVEAHNDLGATLQCLGKSDEAVASYHKALAIKPDYVEARNNLGVALQGLGKSDEAVASYHKVLAIEPDYVEAHYNLGITLRSLGKLNEAVASFRRALAIEPDYVEAHNNLLYTFKFMAKKSSSEIKVEAEKFGKLVRAKAYPFSNWNVLHGPDKRLLVGMVSGDLRVHVVGRFLESILGNFNSPRVEFIAYSNSTVEDEITARLKPYFVQWHQVAVLSDNHLANLIHDDAIDILIDLSGHTALNRLPVFAYKPAPVQATWLGLFATSGVPGMDYIIGDPHIAPHHEADHFTEKIWRLAETWFCVTPPAVSIEPASLPALDNGYVTFGCFNNLAKMNDAVVTLWARILREAPGSKLFLKTVNHDLERRNTLARFAAHGIDPEQLVLEEKSPPAEYYAAYNRIDITLDPFPYNGGMTSLDSLWMAVPVLTRRGERVGSHTGESIALNAGLADWIAHDDEGYVAKAIAHSSDLHQLAKLRAGLRKQVLASPLFDAPRFARHFEDALRGMWHKACGDPRGNGSSH